MPYEYDHLDKVEWAKRHLDTLYDFVGILNKGDPYKAVVNLDKEAGQYVMRLAQTQRRYLDPSLIIGDVLHNLRSSLDTITYAIADIYCTKYSVPLTDGDRVRIQFPINDWSSGFEDPKKGEWHKRLRFLPDEAKAVFQSLQPYVRFKADPELDALSILKHLSNIDKHRRIIVTAIGVNVGDITFTDGGVPAGSRATTFRGSLKHGAIIDSWPEALGRDYRKVNMNPGLPAHIEFGRGTREAGEEVITVLSEIIETVNNVSIKLEGLLDL